MIRFTKEEESLIKALRRQGFYGFQIYVILEVVYRWQKRFEKVEGR